MVIRTDGGESEGLGTHDVRKVLFLLYAAIQSICGGHIGVSADKIGKEVSVSRKGEYFSL